MTPDGNSPSSNQKQCPIPKPSCTKPQPGWLWLLPGVSLLLTDFDRNPMDSLLLVSISIAYEALIIVFAFGSENFGSYSPYSAHVHTIYRIKYLKREPESHFNDIAYIHCKRHATYLARQKSQAVASRSTGYTHVDMHARWRHASDEKGDKMN